MSDQTLPSDSPGLPDLSGRTVLVTGASSGIGEAAARRLAGAGARVLVVGRDRGRTEDVARQVGGEPLVADFARLDDVRRLADDVLARTDALHVLANNAGGLFQQREETVDGHEMTFQVNHLAGFLLTHLLRERLVGTPGARVLNTSSAGNRAGRVRLDDLDTRHRRYSGFRAYSTSKLENVLFTRELARRWRGTGVSTTAFHPGAPATRFGRGSRVAQLVYRSPLARVLAITPEEGAAPLVHLAVRPDPEAVDGAYLDRFSPGRTARQADDPFLAAGLWERSAAVVGVPA